MYIKQNRKINLESKSIISKEGVCAFVNSEQKISKEYYKEGLLFEFKATSSFILLAFKDYEALIKEEELFRLDDVPFCRVKLPLFINSDGFLDSHSDGVDIFDCDKIKEWKEGIEAKKLLLEDSK